MSGGMVSSPSSPAAEWPLPFTMRWLTAKMLLILMTGLQLGWLGVIWLTGATAATYKLLPLMILTAVLGTAVTLLPDRYLTWLPFQENRLARSETIVLLLLGLFIGVILVIFASQQRVWAFDEEGTVLAATVVARDGIRELFENYGRRPWLGKQHPPLVPIIYGLGMRLIGVSQLAARIITAVFALGTGLLTYLIGRRLFNRQTALLAAVLLFTFPLVFRLGAAAMVETPLTFFFTLTVLLTLQLGERPSAGRLLWVGLAFGAGLLSKYTMIFVLPLVFAIITIRGSFKQAVRYFGLMGFIGMLLLVGWLLIANQLDVLQRQIATIMEYAGLVLSSEYGRQVLFETMSNRLPSALGVYNLPLLAVGGLVLINRRRSVDWILLFWILSVWLPLSLTLPDHRYFLPSFPAVALMAALGLQQIRKGMARGLILALLFGVSTLYLYVDWVRAAELFVK